MMQRTNHTQKNHTVPSGAVTSLRVAPFTAPIAAIVPVIIIPAIQARGSGTCS